MKVPANLSGDRLILDYLTKVTVAGTRYLPKGSRIAFIGSTRNRIEREVGPDGAADPAHVREVLARLGDPEELVRAERARIDAERSGRQLQYFKAGGGEGGPVTAPLLSRRINSRWRPGTESGNRRQPADGQDSAKLWGRSPGRRNKLGEGKRKGRLGGLLKDAASRLGAQPGAQPEAGPGAQPDARVAAQPGAQGPAAVAVGEAAAGTAGHVAGTAGHADDTANEAAGAAGKAAAMTAGTAADGTPAQPLGGTAGGTARWPTAGAGGQAPDAAVSAAPGENGTQPLSAAGTQPSGGTGAQPSGGTGAQPSGGTGAQPSGGTGAQPSGGTGTQAPSGGRARPAGGAAPGGDGTRPAGGDGTRPAGGDGTRAAGGGGTRAPTGTSAPGSGTGGGEPAPGEPAGWLTPTAVIPPAAGARQAGRAVPSGPSTPVQGIPALLRRDTRQRGDLTLRAAAVTLGRGAARMAATTGRLARRYPLESAALTLLALGGVILPFPYWLFGGLLGGVLSIWSPIWLARDKWVAIVGPFAVVIVGTVLAAMITGGRGGAVSAYPHDFLLYAGNLLRAGNLLCAAYLAVQARRAPQRRLPPWRR